MFDSKKAKRKLKPEEQPQPESGFISEMKQMASDFAAGITESSVDNVKKRDVERNRRRLGR